MAMFPVTFLLMILLISTTKFAGGAPYGQLQSYNDEDKRSLSKFDQRDLFENDADVLKLLRRLLDDSALNERKRTYQNNDASFDERKRTYQNNDLSDDLDAYVRSMYKERRVQNSNYGQGGFGQNSDEDMSAYGHGYDKYPGTNQGNPQGGSKSGSYNPTNDKSNSSPLAGANQGSGQLGYYDKRRY